jgi:hypothetical protein
LAKVSQKNLAKYKNRIEYAEQKRDAAWRDRWLRYYKKYRNVVDQIIDPKTGKVRTDRSNISIPYAFTMVETVLPRLVETLFAGRPYVTMKGLPPGTSGMPPDELVTMLQTKEKPWDKAAKMMETLIDYQQNVPMDIQDVFAGGLKDMCIYGTTVAYTGWKYAERDVIRRVKKPVMSGIIDPESGAELPLLDDDGLTPIMDFQEETISVKEYDDPEVEFLDLGNFFVDPNAPDIEPARYCGHDCWKSKAELQEMERQGLISVDWKKLAKESQVDEARNLRQTAIGMPSTGDQETFLPEDDLYRVTYYWEDDLRVIILNRCQIVAEGSNPYWHKKKPYVKDVYCRIRGEFYGIGIMEATEDLQDELNVERNQRIDYRSMSMRRMWMMRRGANIDKNQLTWRQNGIVEVEKLDGDLKALEAPDGALGASFNQEQVIKQDIRDAVGAHDIVMGTGSGGTATETMAKDNNASIRFKMLISSVEKRLLLGVTRFMVQMNQQFIEDVRVLPLFDKDEAEWPIITPEEIQGEFHLIPAGSSVEPMANKEAFKQRMVELYGLAANDPLLQQFPIKRRNLLKKVFEAFDLTDMDELLPTDAELGGQLQQQAIQQFITSMPPPLQQAIAAAMHGGGQPAASGLPPGVGGPIVAMPNRGAANTAPMQEMGLQMARGV